MCFLLCGVCEKSAQFEISLGILPQMNNNKIVQRYTLRLNKYTIIFHDVQVNFDMMRWDAIAGTFNMREWIQCRIKMEEQQNKKIHQKMSGAHWNKMGEEHITLVTTSFGTRISQC